MTPWEVTLDKFGIDRANRYPFKAGRTMRWLEEQMGVGKGYISKRIARGGKVSDDDKAKLFRIGALHNIEFELIDFLP